MVVLVGEKLKERAAKVNVISACYCSWMKLLSRNFEIKTITYDN